MTIVILHLKLHTQQVLNVVILQLHIDSFDYDKINQVCTCITLFYFV